MQSDYLIARLATHPDPTGWWKRQRRRMMLASVQPVDDPGVVTVRPYGISKGHGMSTRPVDYTMAHYGGTLRGQTLGKWRKSLMVAPDAQPVNAPTQYSWHGGQHIRRAGEQWWTDDWKDEEV